MGSFAQRLKLLSRDILRVQQGSLYPGRHKLEARGWITSEWKATEEGRTARFYWSCDSRCGR